MSNGLCRLRTRFLGSDEKIEELEKLINTKFFASEAKKIGLVTFSYDDIDWEDEIRIFLEERSSFSSDFNDWVRS